MLKKRFKIIAAVMMTVMLFMILAGCGPASLTKPQRTEGANAVKVTGSCDISIEGDVITVSGETDLMDGVVLRVSILSQDGMTVDYADITKNGDQISHKFSITSEKYGETVKYITGYISCAPSQYGQQPPSAYELYGKKFENIDADESDYVWNSRGIVLTFASEPIEMP